MSTAILVLAAGKSSRMGRPKQLMRWGHESLLRHTITSALESQASEVYVILGAHYDLIRMHISDLSVRILQNETYNKGLGSSIAVGVTQICEASTFDRLVIVLADQPSVNASYLDVLIDRSQTYPESIVATRYEGGAGVPAVFPLAYFPKLRQLAGDRGAGRLLRTIPGVRQVDPPGVLFDLDTPEDYLRHEGDQKHP